MENLDILEEIFQKLDYQTLETCRKVSLDWKFVIEESKFYYLKMVEFHYGKSWMKSMEKFNNHFLYEMAEIIKLVPNSISPLHAAAQIGHFQMVSILLNECIEMPEIQMENSTSPIHLAILHHHFQVYKKIAKFFGIFNPSDENGDTPLHFATRAGQFHICQYILSRIEDANPLNFDGLSPLHIAAQQGFYVIFVAIADKVQNFNPNFKGVTPLILASENGHFSITYYIMDRIDREMFQPEDILQEHKRKRMRGR